MSLSSSLTQACSHAGRILRLANGQASMHKPFSGLCITFACPTGQHRSPGQAQSQCRRHYQRVWISRSRKRAGTIAVITPSQLACLIQFSDELWIIRKLPPAIPNQCVKHHSLWSCLQASRTTCPSFSEMLSVCVLVHSFNKHLLCIYLCLELF